MALNLREICVFGFYGQHNLGDEMFKQPISHLFPDFKCSFYDLDYCHKRHNDSLNELYQREQDCDIGIADYIAKNYRQRKLFHTINHPTVSTVDHVVRTILEYLDMDTAVPDHPDDFAVKTYPIYSSTSQHLDLEFNDPCEYVVNSVTYTPEHMYDVYSQFYSTLPKPIVDYNLDKYSNY
jgi:hypothetical protein